MKRDRQIELLAKARERATERAQSWLTNSRVKASSKAAHLEICKLKKEKSPKAG